MYRYLFPLASLALSLAAHAADADCRVPPLPQSDKTPQAADAARKLSATDPCKTVPGIRAKSLKTVWASLLSNTKLGGRRLETPPPAGIPNGAALARGGKVHVDFAALDGETVRAFRVESGGRVLLDLATPPRELDVAIGRAAPDTEFSWTLLTSAASYHGEFTVIDEAARTDVERQLGLLEEQHLDEVPRLLYQAAIYDEADLYSERDRVFVKLRKLLSL